MPLKRAHGQLLAAWRGKHGVALTARLPWGTMRRFWEEQGVPAALDDRRLLSYVRAYERHGYRQHAPGTAHCVCPPLHRRCPGKQGRPNLREALFEWFCSVRAAVAARIPPAGLAAQARLLREQHMLAALRQNGPVSIPKVTHAWLLRWQKSTKSLCEFRIDDGRSVAWSCWSGCASCGSTWHVYDNYVCCATDTTPESTASIKKPSI